MKELYQVAMRSQMLLRQITGGSKALCFLVCDLEWLLI